MKKIFGIDPSITSTAVTVINQDLSSIKTIFFNETKKYSNMNYHHIIGSVIPKTQRSNGFECYVNKVTNLIVDFIYENIDNNTDTYEINIEGYAFSATGLVFSIAEFVGVLKNKLYVNGIRFNIIPPAKVKKFILKGNSKKSDMLIKFLTNQIYLIEAVNPDQVNEFKKLLSDERYKFNLDKLSSPLSDIMDSLYIAMIGI